MGFSVPVAEEKFRNLIKARNYLAKDQSFIFQKLDSIKANKEDLIAFECDVENVIQKINKLVPDKLDLPHNFYSKFHKIIVTSK